MRYYIGVLLAVLFFAVPWAVYNNPSESARIFETIRKAGHQFAAVVTHNPRSIAYLQTKYKESASQTEKKIRVLIVPGHEPTYGGAEYAHLKERDMAVALSDYIAGYVRSNPKYEVFVTRSTKKWSVPFEGYFINEWDAIVDWRESYKEEMSRLLEVGQVKAEPPVIYHNSAPQDVAVRLYGITKWANENQIDIVLHVHFNDHPGHEYNVSGKYSGFAIYVPARQYSNSETTHAVADEIFENLERYNPVSDLPGESRGIIDEPELIAIGAYNTADAASMLIEYGYIYEPQFMKESVKDVALQDMAYQTYRGIEEFFGTGEEERSPYDTLMVPYTWKSILDDADEYPKDIYALQTALIISGEYPPASFDDNECPRTGKLGPCTKEAIKSFQEKYNIIGEEGIVGPKTLEILNSKFGLKSL